MKKITILESLRGFASFYVAVGHCVLSLKNTPAYLGVLFKFGQEAVIIFFILSGFVIFYSFEKKNETLREYFIKRFRRIYFPLICAMLVSVVLVGGYFSIKELLGNLFMLQDFGLGKPGNIVEPFLGNTPLWSLSYEWVFYLLFPLIFPIIAKRANRAHIVGMVSILNLLIYVLFPNHIFLVFAYFMIWWSGLELAIYFINGTGKSQVKTLFFYYAMVILLLAVPAFYNYRQQHFIQPGVYPYLVLRHFGFAFLCMLLSVYFTSVLKQVLRVLKPFALIAPISYSIYILHYPILVQSNLHLPLAIELPFKIILLLGLAYLIEVVLQPKINKVLR
ncbi:acyltransferase [Mucilaginibacter sp. dw_454]|uniref:acyltransferase family protein n=1 Tax=Mucilaginibacter sp. dw_454 TaxID=2720079 RepID=UPI001BD37049